MPVPGPATKRTGTPATGVPAESVTRTAAAPFIAETVLVRVRTGPPAGVAVVNGDQQAVPVATAVPVPPTVQVRDQFGNPVSGVPILFSPASAAAGSVSGGSQVTDALGRATVGGWTVGTQAGTVSLAVSLQPSGAILGYVPATALPGPPDAIAPAAGVKLTGTPGARLP